MGRGNHRLGLALSLFAALAIVGPSPASGHEAHRRQREAALKARQMQAKGAQEAGVTAPAGINPATMHAPMGDMMELPKVDRSKMSGLARFMDWLGRLHPIIVHFPIAFFPTALFTAIVGRRRPAFAAPVQFMVVAGGVIAPVAAVLGWFGGGFNLAADDWLLTWHRWLGTGIGVGALALAIWAIKKPEQDRSTGMIIALAAISAAIVVQGWFGGAMMRGMDHMNW